MPPINLRKRLIVWICADLLMLGAALTVFAYFHHVRDWDYTPVALVSPSAAPAATPEPVLTPTPAPEDAAPEEDLTPSPDPGPTPNVSGLLRGKYADKFTSGEVERTDMSYRSANVCIEVSRVQSEDPWLTYYLADIYLQDVSSFKTGVARDYAEFNTGPTTSTMDIRQLSGLVGSIVSLSGDYFSTQSAGRWIVRNGMELLRRRPLQHDICVLYYDGTMETYTAKEVDFDAITARNPLHVWTFGPMMLADGQPVTRFPSSEVARANPRAAIGYYEPGHYCFLLVDGRQKNYSLGMTFAELSEFFYSLGCAAAYNLDGGDTAVMAWGDEWLSHPEDERPRLQADILYIVEPDGAGGEA